jgi:predicted CopG family antitoxin
MKKISVSDNFYKLLKKWHEEFNKEVSLRYYKKRMSFVDFTDFITRFRMIELDHSKILSNAINKRRKKPKKYESGFEFGDFIPI